MGMFSGIGSGLKGRWGSVLGMGIGAAMMPFLGPLAGPAGMALASALGGTVDGGYKANKMEDAKQDALEAQKKQASIQARYSGLLGNPYADNGNTAGIHGDYDNRINQFDQAKSKEWSEAVKGGIDLWKLKKQKDAKAAADALVQPPSMLPTPSMGAMDPTLPNFGTQQGQSQYTPPWLIP